MTDLLPLKILDYKPHFIKVIEFIKTDHSFKRLNPEKYTALKPDQLKDIKSFYSRIKECTGEWKLKFPHIEIPLLDNGLKKNKPTVIIGSYIKGNNDDIIWFSNSVDLTFTRNKDQEEQSMIDHEATINIPSCCQTFRIIKKRIVRHFHFDYQPMEKNKPISHLQYGGEVPDDSVFSNIHYCLECKFKIPRILFPPFDLVLIIDLIINEFETPLNKWKKDGRWKNFIKKSQDLCMKKYFENISNHINTSSKTLFQEIYHG